MNQYLSWLHQRRTFSLKDVIAICGNVYTAKSLLYSYKHRHLICRIRADLYAINDLATGICGVSKFEIATAVSSTAYVSHHAALEYHGYAHQLFNEVMVNSKTGFRSFAFDGNKYVYHKSSSDVGVDSPQMDSHVRVTDIERTVLDCIHEIRYAGGLEELLHCLAMIPFLDEQRLLKYLAIYKSMVLYKKTGFLLELFNDNLELSSDFFIQCKEKSQKSVSKLTANSNNYVSEWKLYIPINLNEMISQEGGPLV